MPSAAVAKGSSPKHHAPATTQPPHAAGKTFSLPSMQDFGPKRDCVVCKMHKTTCTLQDALGACERCAVLCIQCARYGCTIAEVRRLYKLQGNENIGLSKFPEIAKNMKDQGLLVSNAVAKKALKQCGSLKGLAKWKAEASEGDDSSSEEEEQAAEHKAGTEDTKCTMLTTF